MDGQAAHQEPRLHDPHARPWLPRGDVGLALGARLLTRAWKLRENVTAYDAMYVALAEALDAPLVTCDRLLARTSGHRATIDVVA